MGEGPEGGPRFVPYRRWGYTKITRDSSYCSKVNTLVLYQSSRGYDSPESVVN